MELSPAGLVPCLRTETKGWSNRLAAPPLDNIFPYLEVVFVVGGLAVVHGLTLSAEHGKGILGECLHLVLARVDGDRGDELYALLDVVSDILRACQTTREEDGIDLALEHCALGSNTLGHIPNHGIEDQLGVLVAMQHPVLHLQHVVGAEVGDDTGLSAHLLDKLVLRVAAREAKTDKVCCGQGSCALGRERSLAVEGVVGVDGLAMVVGSDGDTATEVADDEVEVLVACAWSLA